LGAENEVCGEMAMSAGRFYLAKTDSLCHNGAYMSSTIRLNICMTPPSETVKEVVKLAESLPRQGQRFRVDGRTRHPHLTSFMGTFDSVRLDELLTRLKSLPKVGPLRCNAYGLTISSNYYVEIGYNRNPELDALQVAVAAAIAGMREAGGQVDVGMSELEIANQQTYGYKLFGEAYRPHITLAAYEECREMTFPAPSTFYHLDFSVNELTIAESDHFGSVIRIIENLAL